MAENCHRKKISYQHGRELPQEKNFISAWPRTATGKKFHIAMAENCHRKKNSYRHGRELPFEKKSYRHGRELPFEKKSYRHGRELPLHTHTASYPGAF